MNNLKQTARITGLCYLGLAITGMLGFLLIRPVIHIPGDPAATARNLVDREALARIGVALELGIVLTQVLAAVWFFKLFEMSSNSWGVGALFFGLWLIPMGHVVVSSGRMPKALGWTLIGGGIGYMLSAFLSHGLAAAPAWLTDGLTVPATVGEFWMIGYLLSVGIREPSVQSTT